MSVNVTENEVAKFGRLAPKWWDERGPMGPLHRMNGLRVEWIGTRIDMHFPGGPVRLLDVGCGAGIAAEALARRGYEVLGLDAAAAAIDAAREHASDAGTNVAYRVGTVEALAAEGRQFDVVTALEVIEHVPDQAAFMAGLARLTVPGGLAFLSTLNRTWRSLAFAKIGAEYVARLLPAGTHDWRRFVPPDALAGYGRAAGLRLQDISGMAMNTVTSQWRLSQDVGVNYIAAFSAG